MATKAKKSARKKTAKKGGARKSASRRAATARKPAKKPARKAARRQSPVARVKRVAREVVQQATAVVTSGVETIRDVGGNLVERVRSDG